MLEKLKLLLSRKDSSQDALLTVLLENATQTVLNYTRRTEVPAALEPAVIQIAVVAYNRLGTEGEQSRSEGGISQSFGSDDLPKSVKDQLDRFKIPPKAKVLP